MKNNRINQNKVKVAHIGYFGVMSEKIMDAEKAINYVEQRNEHLYSIGPNNNLNFQTYMTIIAYYGK